MQPESPGTRLPGLFAVARRFGIQIEDIDLVSHQPDYARKFLSSFDEKHYRACRERAPQAGPVAISNDRYGFVAESPLFGSWSELFGKRRFASVGVINAQLYPNVADRLLMANMLPEDVDPLRLDCQFPDARWYMRLRHVRLVRMCGIQMSKDGPILVRYLQLGAKEQDHLSYEETEPAELTS